MPRYNVHAAKTHSSRLIAAAEAGEEVIIMRGNKPAVRLVPESRSGFRFGVLKDVLKGPIPDFLEPMSEEDLALWEGGD